jgi:DNA polymerase-3 subunit alpha
MLGEDFSLKSPAEMKEIWKHLPEAIDTTQKIAEMCSVTLDFGTSHLPQFPLPKGQTADQALRELCEAHLPHRYPERREEARQRLDYELGVIKKTGFASYFLIVADFVNEAKRRGILVGPGRGSAAGSIVSYLTGITGLDPLHYNLLFERFLNPERVSLPDIDLDFADDRRDEIIEYVREKYGHEHVAQIITFGTMAARAAVRDAGRALGFPYSFCDVIAKSIPPFMTFDQALRESVELKEHYDGDPQARRLIDTARKLEGVCRHASTHAAGVVITEKPLTEHVPLQLSSTSSETRDTIVTQYAMNEVEALGLLKMDFLGLKNLTIINDTLERVRARGDEVDIERLPLDDALTYELLQAGRTTGVFQLESAGMKRWLKELKPTEFEDIISILALYRPGPMESIPDFVAAKHGRKVIRYLHPLLRPILEKTYGVIVTQDQVLQIARDFAGFSYAEADILRKAVGKKIKKLLQEQREKFIQGAVSRKKIELSRAEKVWDFIEPFARYGFNRAHAACYAMIAYQTAYLKAHFPAEFMAALLTADEGNVDRQAIEVAEALSLDLRVLPPDINQSVYNFNVVRDTDGTEAIRFGLGAVKNVGHNVASAIITEREEHGLYADLFDLFRRVSSKNFNRKSVESLAKAGAFDQMTERRYVLENLERLLEFNRSLHRKTDAGQQGLFGESSAVPLAPPRITLAEVAPAPKEERLAWEKELLGLYVSEHPLQELRRELEDIVTPMSELPVPMAAGGAEGIRVAGIVSSLKKITTKKGEPMLFVVLEDMTSKVEVLVFPSLLKRTADQWTSGARLLVEGKLSDKDGEVKVLADSVWQLNRESLGNLTQQFIGSPRARRGPVLASASELVIRLHSSLDKTRLLKLRDILAANSTADKEKGIAVVLIYNSDGQARAVRTPFRLLRQHGVRESLAKIVGASSLTLR